MYNTLDQPLYVKWTLEAKAFKMQFSPIFCRCTEGKTR